MEFEYGANAIFSFRQFTGNALTPWGGARNQNAKHSHNATFIFGFGTVRISSVWVWVWVWFAMVGVLWHS